MLNLDPIVFVTSWVSAHQAAIALILLLVLLVAFFLERYPAEVTAMTAAGLFVLLGFVSPDDVMSVFSNPAPITIAAMFVISGALVRAGVLDALASVFIHHARRRPLPTIAVFLLVTMISSAFINNTPIVLVLIPVVIRLAQSMDMASTRLLIPLSYAAVLGGTCTLIGTSTNLLVDGVVREAGMTPFTLFEIAPVGISVAIAGGLMLLLLGPYLLPDRPAGKKGSIISETEFLSEVTILKNYPDIGKAVSQLPDLGRPGMQLKGVRSAGLMMRNQFHEHLIRAGDRIIISASTSELLTLREKTGLRVGMRHTQDNESSEKPVIAEAIVTPLRSAKGERIVNLALGRRHGLRVLGVYRHGEAAGPDLSTIRLQAADRLLMEGPPAGFDSLAMKGDLASISRSNERAFRRHHAPAALMILIGVVVLAAFDVMSLSVLAMLAVSVLLLMRCIDNDEAWASMDISVLVLICAMLVVGLGLQNTGAVNLIVNALSPFLSTLPPMATLILIYVMASILTELVTNNAVAVVLTPIAIGLADQAGVDPRSLVVAIMIGASASFATPIGYQTNTLVYGAGNYRFSDFLKVGIPMNIVVGVVALFAISIFFPL